MPRVSSHTIEYYEGNLDLVADLLRNVWSLLPVAEFAVDDAGTTWYDISIIPTGSLGGVSAVTSVSIASLRAGN